MYFQYFKFQKGHNSCKNWRKLTTLELDHMFIRRKWHAKFQLNISKLVGEKCGKLWLTDGDPDGDPDGRTDRHHHTIIWPVWRRVYKNVACRNFMTFPTWFFFRSSPFVKKTFALFWIAEDGCYSTLNSLYSFCRMTTIKRISSVHDILYVFHSYSLHKISFLLLLFCNSTSWLCRSHIYAYSRLQ